MGDFDLSVGVEVFDHGIYTVVLASNASLVAGALPLVPEHKRPNLNEELFAWYGRMWPEWPIALCCFNNAQAADADPMLWWYEPLDGSRFLAPAVDCHTGGVPDLQALVGVDHWVIAGGKQERHGLNRVRYRDEGNIPPFARALLPDWVAGQRLRTSLQNGDFIVPVNNPTELLRGIVQ